MNIIKIRFSPALDQLGRKENQAADDLFQSISPRFLVSKRIQKPTLDIYETHEEVIVLGDIAGAEPKDIEIEINTRAIRISCKRTPVLNIKNGRYCLAEIQYGVFDRVIFLPSLIDTGVVSASYSNGLIQIRMAKLQMDQP